MQKVKPSNLGYIISTTKSYREKSTERLILESKYSGIPKDKLLIVSSQEDFNECNIVDGYKIIHVKYTGIHLTPMIYLSENLTKYKSIKYWILLHSTCKIGVNFVKRLHSKLDKLNTFDSIPLNTVGNGVRTMDMGIFSIDHIKSFENYWQIMKHNKFDKQILHDLKCQLIANEDLIFSYPPAIPNRATKFNRVNIKNNLISLKGLVNCRDVKTNFVNLNSEKIQEVNYLSLDLLKYQRNFNGLEKISMNANGLVP
tara:strand:- start:262 stop:1029 length:768 start_codon:yes stop_codon:yes gene_type:complete